MFVRSAAVAAMILLALLTGFKSAHADSPVTLTTVTGTVSDGDSKQGVPNATITFANLSGKKTIESASNGAFTATLPVGTYLLKVHAKGFSEATQESVVIGDVPLNIQVVVYASGD